MSHLATLNRPARGGTLAAITDQDQLRQEQLAMLNAEFEPCGWHCWASDEGHFYGTRRRHPADTKSASGVTEDADTARELRVILRKLVGAA